MGLAMVHVLEKLDFEVLYNPEQTCCGQPAFNAGHHEESREVAGSFLDAFRNSSAIICPSGS